MLIPQRLVLSPARMLLVTLSLAIVSGCTSYPTSTMENGRYVLNNDSGTLLQSEQLNEFLSQAPTGGVLNVTDSPWGNHVEIVADATYLAASGRECRRLRVVDGNTAPTTQALVCKTDNGWVNQRVVTQSTEGRFE